MQGPHGNHTNPHTFTMATELVKERGKRNTGASDGLWVFGVIHASSSITPAKKSHIEAHAFVINAIYLIWQDTFLFIKIYDIL